MKACLEHLRRGQAPRIAGSISSQAAIGLHIDTGRFFGQFGNFVSGDGIHALREVAVLYLVVPCVPNPLV